MLRLRQLFFILDLFSPSLDRKRGRQSSAAGIKSLLFILAFCSPVWAQTPAPTPNTPTAKPGTTDTVPGPKSGEDSQEEIQVLDAIEPSPTPSPASDSTTPASTPDTPVPTGPPPVPVNLKILALKEGVYLSWEAPSIASQVASYNIYRSTVPGSGYRKINLKPVSAPYFLDGVENSVSHPKNGEDYFYVVAAVGPTGKSSDYSDEIAISPEGMELPLTEEEKQEAEKAKATPTPEAEQNLNVPEKKILSLQLPADTQLSIQGYKKIEAVFSLQTFPNRVNGGTLGLPNTVNNTTVNQELVVNLQGKVGKNVDVNVDYSDVNRNATGVQGVDQSKQNISIVYHGDSDSPIQEVSFGDLQLYLPNTEFAGFSKQLFGLQGKFKFDRLRLTSFFAQTKGISETKVFTGNAVQVKRDINDTDFLRYKYFILTREPYYPVSGGTPVTTQLSVTVLNPQLLPQNNSEQIWVDPGNGQPGPPNNPNFIVANFGGTFEKWLPGRDYIMDYSTGIITFIRALYPSSRIAVAFVKQNGASVGFAGNGMIDLSSSVSQVNPSGIVTDAAHWLKDNVDPAAVPPNYLLNYFDLGRDKIIPPQEDPNFVFQVIDQGTNNVLQTGTNGPWSYFLNQDLNYLTVTNPSLQPVSVFVSPDRPFAGAFPADGGVGINEPYGQTTPLSNKRIHLEYKTKLDFFRLDRFNIIRGSEAVYLDGRRLRRDVDYFFDYSSGFLDFQDKSILRPDSQVVVTYEYAPFGSFGQSNILGARAEYDITDHFFLGSTFLYDTTQTPLEVPQVGSTPNSLAVIDADAKYDISSEDIQSITGIIPGLENWKPPLSIKLSGEVAQSYFNPDTYSAEGENGVAMVDDMEGIDNVTGPTMSATGWIVSAAPQPPQGGPFSIQPIASASSVSIQNNRVRFYNDSAPSTLLSDFQVIGTSNGNNGLDYSSVPAYGGHIYATSHSQNDIISVLQFPYSHLTSQRWAGLRSVLSTTGTDLSSTRYLQSWVYNDGVPKWIMVDFGVINEDSNGNNYLDSDPALRGGAAVSQASVTYGIPAFYAPGTPWYVNPNGSNPPPNALIGQDASPASLYGFTGYNFEATSQEGVSIGQGTNFVTEDMNGNNLLDSADSYFEYGVQATWTGWQQIKIPVNFTAPDGTNTTPDGLTYFFHSQNLPNPQIVRTVRVWITGTGLSEVSGDFWMENLSFTHNQWQLQVDPNANVNQGVTVNTAKFDVNSISQDQDSRYTGSLRFITITTGQDQTAVQTKEKSLKVTYDLSNADLEPSGNINGKPIYYATRFYTQGVDFTDYKELRMDLRVINYTPGEVLFVRLGNDQVDYYQYNIPLSDAYLNSWNTVIIPLDGSGGNRLQVGTPYINRTSQISIGVLSTNPLPPSVPGELWINNLRTGNPNERSGLARRANAAFLLGNNFATVNARYREVDSGFTQMDQTATHFQHSREVGADYSSSGVILFSSPLVTQFSITQQDHYTEDALSQNPYYIALPNTRTNNATGSIGYTKDLGPGVGRLTNLRVAGSSNYETDIYQPDYLNQPGAQGDTRKGSDNINETATYDAPAKLFFIPLGTNQFNQNFALTHDTQEYLLPDGTFNLNYANYNRLTRVQTYAWTNTTELIKNLIFTPGFTWSLTDATGNTNSPGAPVSLASVVSDFMKFQERQQPKLGVAFKGIPGFTPAADYTGSNQYDYVSFPDGTRLNSSNTLNYSLNMTPGSWISLFQRINLTLFGGRTETANMAVPGYTYLPDYQKWGTAPDFIGDGALTGTKSVQHQFNSTFKLFDVWDFRPTASFSDQQSLLSKGSNPVTQHGDTLGLTTVYNRKIFTIPFINFNLNSAQLQFTRTENTQYAGDGNVDTQTSLDTIALTFPYDINQKAQGNIRLQRTIGKQDSRGTFTYPYDDQATIEYNQKFAPNLVIHIPFTRWKIQLHDAIELRTTFLMDFVNNQSDYVYNQLQTQKYRGTIDLNYNALKNLRVGIGFAYENFQNTSYRLAPGWSPSPNDNKTLDYELWQGTISAEARF